MVIVIVLAVLVVLVAGLVGFRALVAPSAEITREPVATAGANPFMPSVGVDQENVKTVAHVGGRFSGSTPGLYGGSGDDHVCDRSQLSRFLDTNPDKAEGWAAVLGVNAGSIDSYVASLTPVVLRSDTFVTNHGWHDGEVTSFPSVLQAGTAVLVDPYGTPVVRCFCGNPLTAPASFHSVSYIGPTWASFSVTNISVVTTSTTVNNNYTLVDVHTGEGIDRPRGTAGDRDRDVSLPTEPTGTTGTTEPSGPTSSTPPVELGLRGDDRAAGPTTDPTPTSTTPQDPTTLLTSGSWSASSSCPSSLAGASVSFSGGSRGSFTVGGASGGTYTLSGKKLTLTPSSTSSGTSGSGTASSGSSSSGTATSSATSSSAPTSTSTATPKPVTLTLSTTGSPATASGASCTLTHAS